MVNLVHLRPGEVAPIEDADTWMRVEADISGLFFGTGCGLMPDGETVFYISLSEHDVSLGDAVAAAMEWAAMAGRGGEPSPAHRLP